MSFVSIEFVFAALVFFPLYWGLRGHRNWQAFLLILSGYLLYATWSPVSAIALFGFSAYIWLAGELSSIRHDPPIMSCLPPTRPRTPPWPLLCSA